MPSTSMFAQFAALAVLLPLALAQSTISPGASNTRCLQPQHGSLLPGTSLVLGPCAPAAAEQTFFLQNGHIRVFSNQCISIDAAGAVATAECDETNLLSEQQWTYDGASKTFQSAKGPCLDLAHGNTAVGAKVGTVACAAGAANQVWEVVQADGEVPTPEVPVSEVPEPPVGEPTTPVPEPAPTPEPVPVPEPIPEPIPEPAPAPEAGVAIKPATKDNFCLAATENRDGAPVVLADCTGDASQQWVNDKVGEVGTLRVFGDKCLDVTEGRNEKGAKLQIWTCIAGGSNQLFAQKGSHINWYYFGKCIDATDGVFRAGQQAQIWQCSKSKNQDWVLA